MKIKTLFAALFLCASFQYAHAQFLGGIFNQNATERKYLMEQIAAIKVYLGYVKQGNDILHKGTSLIGDIKNGDLDLHKDHFAGLKKIKPALLRDGKVDAIRKMSLTMQEDRKTAMRNSEQSGKFRTEELSELKKIYVSLASEADRDLEELMLVITDGQLQMTDDERIVAINRLHERMQGKYGLQLKLSRNIRVVIQAREKAAKDAATMRGLYGN